MATPPPVLTLAVKKGPREGETRQCRAGAALRVGRVVTGNDLALRDVGTSQRHLAIEFLPPPTARWAVSDLGSSNGTLLNGAPIVPTVPATLSHGDLIKIGESTVLAVSIASDSDPNPDAKPAPRRASRHSAAAVAVEEKPPVVTRRGGRKNAAAPAEPPNAENEEPDAAAVVEAEKPPVVTRRGGRKKAAAAEPPEEGKEEREEAAEATRRGGRKKAAEPPEADKEEREEAAVVTCRGGRKKAAEPPEADQQQQEEAAVVTRRGGRKKVAATAAPPLPPNTRSGRGRGRVTRASARKAFLEEEDEEQQEEGEVAAPIERGGDQERVVAANGGGDGEEEDRVEAGDGELEGTAKASEEEVPVARDAATAAPPLPPNTRSRRGRGRLTRASARKAVLEEEENEEREEVTAPIERRGDQARVAAANGGGGEEEDRVAAGDGGVEGTAKASEEEVPVARRGRPWREPKGRANAPQCADSDNEGEEGKGGAEEEEDGKGEVIGSEGDVGDGEKVERAGRSSLETMTLREWFERMEKYLPRMINEAADEMIAALQERHRLVNEYISTLGESSDPA